MISEIEPTWRQVVAVSWLIAWRYFLGGAIIAAIVGFLVGLIGAAADAQKLTPTVAAAVAGLLGSIAWGISVIGMALKKRYQTFRIVLVRSERQIGVS